MGLIERVRHTYAQCLCCLRHFPEIWYDVAQFEEESGDLDRAAATYVEAVGVLPKGELLRVAQADLEEARGHLKEARELWGSYLEAFSSSTFAHTLYQRFVRRTEGKNAARKAFSNTLALRKAGKLGYQIYLAHAALEQHINEEPDVAQRILEYGLSQHASFISEPEYVLYYCNFLMERGDEGNLRVLFERVLDPSALPTDKAGDVWERFVQLEFAKSKSGGSLVKTRDVEARRAVAFPDDPTVRGIQGLWKRCSSVGLAVSVLSPADIEAVRRTNPATKDREDARVSRKKRWDAKGEAAGGSDSKREKRKAGGGDKSSSVPPLIPPFLAKVFLSLPRHSGSPYDADEIIWQLKSAAMPSAPEALPDSGRGKKRDQGAGSDESDHENDDRLSGGRKSARGDFQQANDIFRQRQMEKIGVK
jgi:tetratricopeptide (TPR) repeat protein